jgi:hypothetical protein
MPMSDALRGTADLVAEYRSLAQSASDAASKKSGVRPTNPKVPRQTLAAVNRALIIGFTKDLRFRLEISGQHYSGLSNQAMLEVRQNEGREFDHNSVQLKQHVRKEMLERFAGIGRDLTFDDLKGLAEKLVHQQIVERVMHGGLDISLQPLTPAYAEWKRKNGGSGKPIGVLRGKWIEALRRKGRVVLET